MDQLSSLSEPTDLIEIQEVQSWKQHGIFVDDASISMTSLVQQPDTSLPAITKAAAVEMACRDLVNRLQASAKRANFSLDIVKYADTVKEARRLGPIDQIAVQPGMFDPTSHGTGGTDISTGLAAAQRLAEQFYRDEATSGLPVSVVVMLMTDGQCGNPSSTVRVAEALKSADQRTKLCCCFFATKGSPTAGSQLLQAIASPGMYETVYDAEQLRRFFLASITATSPAPAPAALAAGAGA